MSDWRFAGNTLMVLKLPKPGRSGGYRKRTFEPPGYDGISAVLDDGRLPVKVSVTVETITHAEHETLSALFESGTNGDLEVPHGDDAWVYANAFVDGLVSWEKNTDGNWQARVNFTCPDPRPTRLSTGELVF